MHFLPDDLYNCWASLVEVYRNAWSWDCKEYSKSRAATPDVFTLRRFVVPLQPLLTMCPSGFPAQNNVSEALAMLQEKHQVFGQLTPTQVRKTCTEAADIWRTMCKHVYNLSKEKPWPKLVENLCKIIIHPGTKPDSPRDMGSDSALSDTQLSSALPDTQPGSALPETIPDTLSPEEVENMWPKHEVDIDDISDDSASGSVEIMDVTCKCPECAGAEVPSSSKEPCTRTVPVPAAKKGAQRTETVKTDSKRGPMKRPSAKRGMKRPSACVEIQLPVTPVYRSGHEGKLDAETYIMMKKPRKYVVGQTARMSPNHRANILKVIEKIEKGEIKDTWAAKQFLRELP